MPKKIVHCLVLLSWVCGLCLEGPVYSQDSPKTVSPDKNTVPFSVTNAFFNRYGKPWAAATEEEQANFLERYDLQATRTPGVADATGISSSASPTLKVPFQIRNAYFVKYGKDWELATEAERKDFLKVMAQKEKARKAEEKAFVKKRRAEEKARLQRKKGEEKKIRARLKAERDRKKAEDNKKREAARKKAAAKRRVSRLK